MNFFVLLYEFIILQFCMYDTYTKHYIPYNGSLSCALNKRNIIPVSLQGDAVFYRQTQIFYLFIFVFHRDPSAIK